MRGKELIFTVTESGCVVPTSHKLNADGYFRKKKQFGVSFSSACKWIREWKA